jgi:methionyl aminopeptidase
MIKTAEEIVKMRVAGKLAAETLLMIQEHVKPGVTTEHLDKLCHDFIVNDLKSIPACLGYKGFPKSVCTSVNEVVCHGIPGPYILKNGDIMNLDVTVIKDGFHGDTSIMLSVGDVSFEASRLIEYTEKAMLMAIKKVGPGVSLREVGRTIQDYVEHQGYSSVRMFSGHGIGREFHEQPAVLHFYHPDAKDVYLKPGMTFTIEPMVNAGGVECEILDDGWTAVTKDRRLSAQWEHTILVTENGYDILTKR